MVDTPDMSGYVRHHNSEIDEAGERHPEDPEPVRASTARAVWWLGVVAVLTGPLVGGVVPATIALALARQFRRDAYPSAGFLTGAARVRRGELLAWSGLFLAAAAVVAAILVAVFGYALTPQGPEFPPAID